MRSQAFLVALLSLAACGDSETVVPAVETTPAAVAEPDPTPGAPATSPAPSGGPTGAEAAAPPVADPQSPPPETEGEKVELEAPQGPPDELELPSFASIIGDGPTVTVTVKLEGGDRGELTFQRLEDGVPAMVHVEIVEGSSEAQITAPARYDAPLYVAFSAAVGKDEGPDAALGVAAGTPGRQAPVQVGGAAEPITLAGQDIELSITVGDKPGWLTQLATQGPVPFGGTAPGAPPQGG